MGHRDVLEGCLACPVTEGESLHTPMAGSSIGNCILPSCLVASMSVVHTLYALEHTWFQVESALFFKTHTPCHRVIVCGVCCDQGPQSRWLRPIETCCLTVLEAGGRDQGVGRVASF